MTCSFHYALVYSNVELKHPDFTPYGVVLFVLLVYFSVSTILFKQIYFITWHIHPQVGVDRAL